MRSLEHMNSKSRNLDTPRDPEGIFGSSESPKSFEEHMQDLRGVQNLKEMIDDLPQLDDEVHAAKREEEISKARDAVLDVFDKEKSGDEDEQRISSSVNRVFEAKFGLHYDDNPNVFRTNENSVYRVTGLSQIADIVNCGHVRSKQGRHKGGTTEPIVYWSKGGDKLNYVDERPIIETSAETVCDGQVGAVSLDDLTGIWVTNSETGKKENRLAEIKNIRKLRDEGTKMTVEELNQKLGHEY